MAVGGEHLPLDAVAPVPAVKPGRYRVEWQVLSTDGHVVTGRYSFTVGR